MKKAGIDTGIGVEAKPLKNGDWVFTPHPAAGGVAAYKPRTGDIVYSDDRAYSLSWADAINQPTPLRFVQVQEVYGLFVKFTLFEGAKGDLRELSINTLSEPGFLSFLRTGKLAADG